MKMLAIIIGSVLAAVVITIAAFVIHWYVTSDSEDYSRGGYLIPIAKLYIYMCERPSAFSYPSFL